jgi:hypothetical protein
MIKYLLFSLLVLPLGFAQSCLEQFPNALVYKGIAEAVGLIYFEQIDANDKQTKFRFSGGVCLEGKEGWQLLTENIEVTDIPEAKAENVSVKFQGWQLQADFLQATTSGLTMQGISFFGEGIQGLAKEASYDFITQEIRLMNASSTGENLRIEGQVARLVDGQVFFEGIEATTCNCESEPLYKLNAQQATLELNGQILFIEKGTLSVLGIPITLNKIEVSPKSAETFRFPIVIEYISDSSSVEGSGLGIRIPSVRIDPNLNLEVGVVGLDDTYPLKGVLLAHYQDDVHTFDVGYAPEGFQADFTVRQPLKPTTKAVFAVHNRDWASQDYLHEGLIGIETGSSWQWGQQKLSFQVDTFAAVSSQTLKDTPFHDGRLFNEARLSYLLPTNFGAFNLGVKTSASYYPLHNQFQWGVNLNPDWQFQTGPLGLRITFVQQWTNSASPFSSKLDKLEPKRQLTVSTSLKGPLSTTLNGNLSFRARYDFLDNERSINGFDELSFRGQLDWEYQDVVLSPYIAGEYAALLNPDLESDSYSQFGLDVLAPRWEAGASATLNEDFKLHKLEFRTAFPLDFNDLSLKPFIAIDIMPTLAASEFPRISGHGLELTWRSCCGTISLGYRQEENAFKTLIGFSLQ